MTINKEISRLERSNIKLTVTIGKDDTRSEYDALLLDYSKKIQIPGFRKGKVPRDVLVRKFGDALKGEVLGRIIEKSLGEIFEDESFPIESKPLPYSVPRLEDEEKLELKFDEGLVFSVVYDVMPAVNVEKWNGFEVTVPDVAITDEDINLELETIRERNSIVMDKPDDETAGNDNVVTINYCELGDGGEVLAGSEREDFTFTLGSGRILYKIDEEITGMKKGETKDFEKTYADDFEDAELAGKKIKLRVSLTALKIKKLPDLDDELAQDVNEKFNTLDDLKRDIRDRLGLDLDRRMRACKVSAILEKIMEIAPAQIPESMTKLELDSRWRNLARRFNTDSEGLFKIMGKNPAGVQGILDEWTPDANKAVHSRLIVETLIENFNIEASDDEAEKEIEIQAAENDTPLEDFKEYYKNEEMTGYLKEEIKDRKLFDRLIAENTVKPGEKEKYADFIRKNR
ncbi:MAG: trigger factor [Treponema sp.]|nr:trigger factor [Treponema sp.]